MNASYICPGNVISAREAIAQGTGCAAPGNACI